MVRNGAVTASSCSGTFARSDNIRRGPLEQNILFQLAVSIHFQWLGLQCTLLSLLKAYEPMAFTRYWKDWTTLPTLRLFARRTTYIAAIAPYYGIMRVLAM